MKPLLLILFILLYSHCTMEKRSKLSVVSKTELLNFPSASSIEFYKDRLYVIGDDARNLAILDKQYRLIDTVLLFPGETLRIPKKTKMDLEASTIIRHCNKDHLLVAGSSSTPEREYLLLFPLDDLMNYERIPTSAFVPALKQAGIREVNIEGLVAINNLLVLGNRGNAAHPQNHLIIVPGNIDALNNEKPQLIELDLAQDGQVKGLSGLAYISSLDMMLFTASVEETDNAVDDGAIGNSYLGYVANFRSKMQQRVLVPDALWNLSETQSEFRNEKIESVAVESAGEDIILHLVADNDNGTSTLFKLSLPNPL